MTPSTLTGVGWVKKERPAGTPGTKPLIDEWTFTPDSIEQARDLYRAMVEAGTPPPRARHIIAWLIVKPPRAEDDPTARSARSEFRKVLAELGAPPWEVSGGGEEAPAGARVG